MAIFDDAILERSSSPQQGLGRIRFKSQANLKPIYSTKNLYAKKQQRKLDHLMKQNSFQVKVPNRNYAVRPQLTLRDSFQPTMKAYFEQPRVSPIRTMQTSSSKSPQRARSLKQQHPPKDTDKAVTSFYKVSKLPMSMVGGSRYQATKSSKMLMPKSLRDAVFGRRKQMGGGSLINCSMNPNENKINDQE
jgi:hypothetical protein